jgi:hypothetical protein
MRALTSIALAALALLTAAESAAREILIPNVVAFARGSHDSLWGTEVRLINPTTSPKSFRVVDWIGSPRQVPYEVTVPAGQTKTVGGFQLYANWPHGTPPLEVTDQAEFGAALCEADEGLITLSRVLTSTVAASPEDERITICSPNSGEYVYPPRAPFAACNWGVGPILYADRSFFEPGALQNLLMLNPRRNHYRTNLVIVNGDPMESTVSIVVTNATGTTARVDRTVPGRTYYQLNDIYDLPELRGLEELSEDTAYFAQRATVTCSTRCYAIGYVISNHNNTVSVVEPR